MKLKSLNDLDLFADEFARRLRGGCHIGLTGPLGAGKTTFVQALAKELGIKSFLGSPTFTLRQSYAVTDRPSIKTLVHLDLYRLNDDAAISELGLIDDWRDPQTIVLIEWVERAKNPKLDLDYHLIFSWEPTTDERTIEIHEK